MEYPLKTIGVIHSCYKTKFGIPRQPGLAPTASATLELLPPFDNEDALNGLTGFSHLWILFLFHKAMRENWLPTVRPPRLGGKKRVGVFASRSPFRPNPIGLSAVGFDGYVREDGKLLLRLKGVDLLDGTPVLDIKPYLPYADSIPDATGGFAAEAPETPMTVFLSDEAQLQCEVFEREGYGNLRVLIEETLRYDARPVYRKKEKGVSQFGMRLSDFDVKWQLEENTITVLSIVKA